MVVFLFVFHVPTAEESIKNGRRPELEVQKKKKQNEKLQERPIETLRKIRRREENRKCGRRSEAIDRSIDRNGNVSN